MTQAQAVLTMSSSKKRLVLAKFRPRIHHRGRISQRIYCQRERDKRNVANQSIQNCVGCRSKVKLTELGVFCSYGIKNKLPRVVATP